jgi:hypothetical protein
MILLRHLVSLVRPTGASGSYTRALYSTQTSQRMNRKTTIGRATPISRYIGPRSTTILFFVDEKWLGSELRDANVVANDA